MKEILTIIIYGVICFGVGFIVSLRLQSTKKLYLNPKSYVLAKLRELVTELEELKEDNESLEECRKTDS